MYKISCILITLLFGFVRCYLDYCDDLSPPLGDINFDEISGVWDGVEIIPHTKEYEMENANECFHINITQRYIQSYTSFDGQKRIHHLVVEWYENETKVDYYIKVNPAYKGFWPMEFPNGPVSRMEHVNGGIIQVLKVSDNELVLNFCIPHSQFFTVILARNENQLNVEELANIHSVIFNKNLSMSTINRVCVNSALALMVPNIHLSIVWIFIVLTLISNNMYLK